MSAEGAAQQPSRASLEANANFFTSSSQGVVRDIDEIGPALDPHIGLNFFTPSDGRAYRCADPPHAHTSELTA